MKSAVAAAPPRGSDFYSLQIDWPVFGVRHSLWLTCVTMNTSKYVFFHFLVSVCLLYVFFHFSIYVYLPILIACAARRYLSIADSCLCAACLRSHVIYAQFLRPNNSSRTCRSFSLMSLICNIPVVEQDPQRRVELLTRLHVLAQHLPVTAPHYNSLLLNYIVGVVHYIRVAQVSALQSFLAAAIPLLCLYVCPYRFVL